MGRLKIADKGMKRERSAVALNYLSSNSRFMESEQGYGGALCLPNPPCEKHGFVSDRKCALSTESLKSSAERALGTPGNIRVRSMEGRKQKCS